MHKNEDVLNLYSILLQTYTHIHVCVVINGSSCCSPSVSQTNPLSVCRIFIGFCLRCKSASDNVFFHRPFLDSFFLGLFSNFGFSFFGSFRYIDLIDLVHLGWWLQFLFICCVRNCFTFSRLTFLWFSFVRIFFRFIFFLSHECLPCQ